MSRSPPGAAVTRQTGVARRFVQRKGLQDSRPVRQYLVAEPTHWRDWARWDHTQSGYAWSSEGNCVHSEVTGWSLEGSKGFLCRSSV